MKLSPAQRFILSYLDGAIGPIELNGTYKRSLDVLKRMGLVTYRQGRKSSKTFYFPDATTMVLHVSLTKEGSDFIYNGGIDK